MRIKRAFLGTVALILACSVVWAQAARRRPRVLPGEPLELKTRDGWTLAARYYPSQPDHLTFILLHQAGGRKEDWIPLARAMILKGYGVLGLDLRGHGGSQNPPPGGEPHWWEFKISKDYNEWANMGQDVDAAVDALKARGASESSIALGGAEVGSSIALRYAAVHKQIPMVFMLSPGVRYRELTTVNIIRLYYGNRPLLMVVGQDDKPSVVTETGILYQFAKIAIGAENAQLISVGREHGTKMLTANRGLIDRLIDWMGHPVQTPAAAPAAPSVNNALGTAGSDHGSPAVPAVSTGAETPAPPVPGVTIMPTDSDLPQDTTPPSSAQPSSPE